MSAIDIIKRRLKEERVPDVPDEITEKKKRPREVAFMDVNLCFPCGKCPEFCPVQCIEYLAPGMLPGRGVQPVQDRFQECIGCYICVEVCALLTDYDKILRLIRGTTTTTGLKVRAYLDSKEYPLKVKPSAQRLRELRITRHTTLPKWNYTITPSNGK